MDDKDRPFWNETPSQRPGQPSVFELPQFDELKGRPKVSIDTIWQCNYNARTSKPTDIMHNGVKLSKAGVV